jgi:carboxymethylenebutenolidase
VGRLDWDVAVSDGLAALEAMSGTVPGVTSGPGLVGFCFGGGLAFAVAGQAAPTARRDQVLVSYYGSALPNLLGLADRVTWPSLHHFGLADTYLPPDTVRAIEAAVTAHHDDVTVLTYPGAGHAFDNPSPLFHHAGASEQAWTATTTWLAENLPV